MGNIGESQITMYINIEDSAYGKITGKYYYNNIKQFIPLNGTIKDNIAEIKEGNDTNYTGTFSGTVLKDGSFKGEWYSIDKNKRYNFNLTKPITYSINSASIIQSEIKLERKNGAKFSCTKSSIFINNPKDLSSIDKITANFNGIRKVSEKRVISSLNDKVQAEYNQWNENKDLQVNYDILSDVSVSYLDEKIISISSFDYSYTGGAHGIYGVFPKIYSIETGRDIGKSASDLVYNIKDRTLVEIMKKKLLENLKEGDYFKFNDIELSNTFDITPNGVKFIWQIYDIAPYSVGMIEINFTFNELKPFIDPNSPFAYLFK